MGGGRGKKICFFHLEQVSEPLSVQVDLKSLHRNKGNPNKKINGRRYSVLEPKDTIITVLQRKSILKKFHFYFYSGKYLFFNSIIIVSIPTRTTDYGY